MTTSARIRTTTAIVALITSAAFAAAAHAAPAADLPSVVVKYHPARIATEQGARELYRRIERAAAQVCPEGSAGSRVLNALVQQCRQDAIARAVGEIHERHLVEIAAAHANRG